MAANSETRLKEVVAEAIREAVTAAGTPQGLIAEQHGFHRGTLSRIVNGTNLESVGLRQMLIYADLMGLEFDVSAHALGATPGT